MAEFQVIDKRRSRFAAIYAAEWDTDRFRTLSPTTRVVYVSLCLFAGATTHQCWPKVRRLEGMTGLSERTVRRSISKLAALGYIVVGKVQLKRKRINVYTLLSPPEYPPIPEGPGAALST